MKIRILDRVLVFFCGLLLLAVCAAAAAQLFFNADVIGWFSGLLNNQQNRVWLIVILVLLIALGVYCVLMMFRRHGWKDKFIMQKTDNGELAISLKAMESMVQKCLEPHKELTTQSVQLENQKGGLLIKIRGVVASGVSIPLTIDALQQQIKQYVTACSGVEVKDIRVQIESSGPEAPGAMFAIEPPAAKALPASAEGTEENETEENTDAADSMSTEEVEKIMAEIPAPNPSDSEDSSSDVVVPAAAAAAAEMLKNEAPQEDDDRPIHQRLFSNPEEPCVMPMPPEAEENDKDAVKEEKPAEKTAKDEKTAGETVKEEKPAEKAEPEEKPAEETVKAEKPAEEAAKDNTPVNDVNEGSKEE